MCHVRNNDTFSLKPESSTAAPLTQTTRAWRRGASVQSPEFPGAKPPRCGLRALSAPGRPERRQSFWAAAVCVARLLASGRARLRPEERAVPHRFVPAVKTVAASHKPPARALRKAPPAGPHLRGCFGAREAAGRSDGKQAVLADEYPGRAKEAFPGRTRTRELGGAFLSESERWNGERVALRPLRTRRGLAPPMRARGRHYLFSSVQPRSSTSGSREVWREVGGALHASAACKKGEGEGDPRQRYPVNTQSGAGMTPPPVLTLLAGRPDGRGGPWGWGRARGGDEEAGAGGQ